MQITILCQGTSESFFIEISEELSVDDLKAYIEAETDIPIEAQALIYNSRTLIDGQATLGQLKIAENGLILLQDVTNNVHAGKKPSHNTDTASNAQLKKVHKNSRPESAQRDVVSSNSIGSENMDGETFKSLQKIHNNPDDPESQIRILEMIRQSQVEENLQLAFDISPESFVAVNLLYIKLRINNHDAFALVDTGAQNTVIHPKLAEKFGILNLIDKRFASMTVGVGTQRSEGRVHSVPVSLGDLGVELPCSFTVLDIHVGILFGLDMLRRHKCNVDLSKDVLAIGDKEIKFLSDHEIEKYVLPSQTHSKLPPHVQPNSPQEGKTSMESLSWVERNDEFEKSNAEHVFPESSVSKIMSLGFTRKEVIEALRQADGNVELAASSLF